MPYELLQVNIPCFTFSLYKGEHLCILTEDYSCRRKLLETLCGIRRPSDGVLLLDNHILSMKDYSSACANGIHLINGSHLISDMNIAENLFLTNPAYYSGLTVRKTKKMNEDAGSLLAAFHLTHLDPRRQVRSLSSVDRYNVSILRSVASDAKILILDDPTLYIETPEELQMIAAVLGELRNRSVSLLCFSSRWNSFCYRFDRCVIIRDEVITRISSPSEACAFLDVENRMYMPVLYPGIPGEQTEILCRKTESSSPEISAPLSFHVNIGDTTGICCRSCMLSEFRAQTGGREEQAAVIARETENDRIFPYMSLYDNVALLLNSPVYNRFSVMNRRIRDHMARTTLEKLDAADLITRYGNASSLDDMDVSDQITVEIAKWVCAGVKILIFSKQAESGSGLSSIQSENLLSRLNRIGVTCVVISGSEESLKRICSNVITV